MRAHVQSRSNCSSLRRIDCPSLRNGRGRRDSSGNGVGQEVAMGKQQRRTKLEGSMEACGGSAQDWDGNSITNDESRQHGRAGGERRTRSGPLGGKRQGRWHSDGPGCRCLRLLVNGAKTGLVWEKACNSGSGARRQSQAAGSGLLTRARAAGGPWRFNESERAPPGATGTGGLA